MASDVAPVHALYGVGLNTVLRHLKTQAAVGNPRIQPGSDVIVCAEMDEQWGWLPVLNHVSAGCFTRMTGYEDSLWRTSSVNALWPHWASSEPAVGL